MDIASLNAAAAAGRESSQTRVSGSADAAAQAFQKADQRLQQQRNQVSVEVSSAGKLKAAFSQAQAASTVLGDVKQTSTDAGVTKAANNFVKAFNSVAKTARSATTQKGALAGANLAHAAENNLLRTVSADSTAKSELKKIGIAQQNDGTLALDARKFEAALKANSEAVRSTLSSVGEKVDRTATRELANTGNLGKSESLLDNRATNLENQQAAQQAQAAAAQQTISTRTADLNKSLNNLNTGAAAYQRVFSL
jgi:flagellar hook-associated protein 2